MKKLLCLVLALVLLLSITSAAFAAKTIDGLGKRKIKIKEAKLNTAPETLLADNISPTTGRDLTTIKVPDGFTGSAATGLYVPVMVQISNAGGGVGVNSKGQPSTAPVNAQYADVVYEAPQANSKNGASLTRFSMIFSDTVPDFVGFVRSTRLTHVSLRQEWDCAFCTSGYPAKDVKPAWRKMGVKNPESATEKDPGLVYVGDFPKVWKKYVQRLSSITDANSELFQLAKIVQDIVPKKHKAANHTWKYTDDIPSAGDKGVFIDITFGGGSKTDSHLEYDEVNNVYLRYVPVKGEGNVPFRPQKLINARVTKKNVKGIKTDVIEVDDRVFEDEPLAFTNVIIQGIEMKWLGGERPNPKMTGSGNADYFSGGKHIAGVWSRKNDNSRTVYYGPDGKEIELMRGKTLIVLMDYNSKGRSVKYE